MHRIIFDGVGRSLVWNDEDRLTGAPGVLPGTQAYNGDGARVSRNGAATRRAGSSVTSPVVREGSRKIFPGLMENDEPYYHRVYLSDRLGTVSHVAPANGVFLLGTFEPDAFGVPVARSGEQMRGSWKGGWGYDDEGGGLHLVGHRWYDADAGRFLTRDPARAGRNWWSYCGNDPVNMVDPSGLTIRLVGFNKEESKEIQASISKMKKSKYVTVRRMIWTLLLDKKDHIIAPAEDKDNRNAKSKGNIVRFYPFSRFTANDGKGHAEIYYTPDVILAHELGHQVGLRDPGESDRGLVGGYVKPGDVVFEIENPFRLELGLSLRYYWTP